MNNNLFKKVSLVFLLIVIITDESTTQGLFGKGKGKNKGNCTYIINKSGLNSPQFAQLCRLTNGTNAALPAFQGLTADQVCDGDCRCVMGAQGGGKCGTSPSDKKIYCICDYANPSTVPVPSALACAVLPIVGELCTSKAGVAGKFLKNLCNADCQCSHGYPSSKNNKCTTKNGVAGNKVTYCVCNNGNNLN